MQVLGGQSFDGRAQVMVEIGRTAFDARFKLAFDVRCALTNGYYRPTGRSLPPANSPVDANIMTIEVDLNIAEIPYESGAIRFRYARVMAPDRTRWIRHGFFVEYHENGTVASEGQYVDGKEDGLWRDFHPNGQPASEGCYREGKEVGVWQFWSSDGTAEPSTSFS